MKITSMPNMLVFEGILDENVSHDSLMEAYKKAVTSKDTAIVLDFSGVSYANSAGVIVWMNFFTKLRAAFKYVNAPIWLVNQFNFIKGYFDNGSYAQSIQVPFFSTRTQDSVIVTLEIGREIPVLPDYTNVKLANRMINGMEFEIDFYPERYFAFISENYELFKEKIKWSA